MTWGWGRENKKIYFILVDIDQMKKHIFHRRWRNEFCIWEKYSKTIFQNQTIIISTVYIIKPKSDFWLLVSETDLQTGISNWCQTQCSWFLADFPEYQRIKYGEAGVSCVADLWRLCNVAMQSQSMARQWHSTCSFFFLNLTFLRHAFVAFLNSNFSRESYIAEWQ